MDDVCLQINSQGYKLTPQLLRASSVNLVGAAITLNHLCGVLQLSNWPLLVLEAVFQSNRTAN